MKCSDLPNIALGARGRARNKKHQNQTKQQKALKAQIQISTEGNPFLYNRCSIRSISLSQAKQTGNQ